MKPHPYQTQLDILRAHGIFVLCGYWLAKLSKWTTPTGLWLQLGRLPWLRRFTADGGRPNPWWQDVGVLLVLLVTAGLAALAFLRTPSDRLAFAASFLLVDTVAYHARVLWFDDLERGASWGILREVSYRQLLFHASLNFFESILLFGVLYERGGCLREPPPEVYSASFMVATTLRAPETLSGCGGLVIAQALLSLFFFAVIISNLASAASARHKLSPIDDA
jgi:hypothetical protein